MNWKTAFSTAIGKKLIMGLTGIFLILFLVVHCYVNAQIFWNDGGVTFNEHAHFFGTNPIIRTIEIGLFVFLIWHMVQGLLLAYNNTKRRSTRYAVKSRNTSRWYSRSMGLLGTLILLFLILHLSAFWIPNRGSQLVTGEEIDLFEKMKLTFSEAWIVIIYVLGCISLAFHLLHGFYSAFQTLGLATHRYKGLIRGIGVAFSIFVPAVFAAMPIAFFTQWIQ